VPARSVVYTSNYYSKRRCAKAPVFTAASDQEEKIKGRKYNKGKGKGVIRR
jgi:hypothetical protein